MNLIDKTDSQLEALHTTLVQRQGIAEQAAKDAGERAMRHGRKIEELSNPTYQAAYFADEIEKFTSLRDDRNRQKDEYDEQAADLASSVKEVEAEIEARKKEAAA